MEDQIVVELTVLGFPLRATALRAGEDWSVLVQGGFGPHIGSVSVARWVDRRVELQRLVGPGHRDDVVGDRFALRLAEGTGHTVCVCCGIHYDGPTKAELAQVVASAEVLLEKLLKEL